MDRETDLLGPPGVLAGWLAAAWALPFAALLAVLGQAAGAVMAGCSFIGLTLPVDRPVWALVNQPLLSFAASPAASGYWLGSLVAPAVVAAFTLGFVPRPRSTAAELAAIQVVWSAIVVGLAWLPVLDLSDGHLARWLHFRRLPEPLVAAPAVLAAALAIVPALRLLAMQRSARRHLGRGLRLLTVLLHLWLPASLWFALATVVAGQPAAIPLLAVAGPLLAVAVVAWIGYPATLARRLAPVTVGAFARGLMVATLLGSLTWLAGRPLSEDRRSGILWGAPTSTNNIRSWVEPLATRDFELRSRAPSS